MDLRPKTIICDIDGTLVKHNIPAFNTSSDIKLELLPGTLEKLSEWDTKGYNIILITGRRESMRMATEKQLSELGIFYDHLIMGVGGGCRVLINDKKPDGKETAFSISPNRNEGIKNIDI
jgi:hydroxymethylpyrimidine pyrophosphatase-like HAD family hydrolase